jgi:hypothetical protein
MAMSRVEPEKSGAERSSAPDLMRVFRSVERGREERSAAGAANPLRIAIDIRLGQRAGEFVNLLFRLVFGHAVSFLELPDQLVALPVDRCQVVIR